MNVAIVGSRSKVDPSRIEAFLDRLHAGTVVVSGGARGVDQAAEKGWLKRGGRVISFRPHQLESGSFGIMEYGFSPDGPGYTKLHTEPTWADRTSALFYRNSLIAAASDYVAYWMSAPMGTPGTQSTLDFAKAYGKKVYSP